MEEIIWLKDASNDLVEIYNYISRDSIHYANKTVDNIIEKIDNLVYFPYIGRKTKIYSDGEFRELIYKSYKIIYEIDGSIIYIHRIWHSARLNKNLFHK